MCEIKIQCPAKINLTLEIVNRREDGFHNIKSIMHMISLYDYLTIKACPSVSTEIKLTGNCTEIPYDENNLVYKAAVLFLQKINKTAEIDIFIEKNIPISAGLAGGSTDAVGTLIGLNELFNKPLSNESLHELCAQLGSDLNVCLEGGCILATSKGEKIQKLKTIKSPVSLIKPPNLGISAKEAYTKYALKEEKPKYNMTEKMINAIESGDDIKKFLYNDLEYAVFEDYKELREIKSKYPSAIMSGSGSTYFILENIPTLPGYQTINGLEFIETGCRPV